MKILFYIDSAEQIGGAQRVMSILVNGFCERGYEVVFVNDYQADKDTVQYYINKQVRRFFLQKKINGSVVRKNVLRIWRLRGILKMEKPDVAISFLGHENSRLLLSSIGLKCKKIVSVRNDPNREYGSSRYKKFFINLLFLLSDYIVVQTEDVKGYFSKKLRNRCEIIINPVDEIFFNTPRSKIVKNIVSIGRIDHQKNYKMLIDSFILIKDLYPNEKLIIYGEGPLRNQLIEYTKSKGISNRVIMPGKTADINRILAKARLFAMSSDYEGLPNALMEAIAMGVPVLATDCPCGGPRYLIQNKKQGELVKCNNVREMAEKMNKMLKNKYIASCYEKYEKERAQDFRQDIILNNWEMLISR